MTPWLAQAFCLSLVGFCATVPGQTYVVDAQGGGSFTDLPAAIAAVPNGAVLLVRPGTYSAFSVANTSLTILGDDPSTVLVTMGTTNLVVGPTSTSDRVVIQNLHLKAQPIGTATLLVKDAVGPVVLDHVTYETAQPSLLGFDQRVQVERSTNVHLFSCTLQPTTNQGNGFGKIDVTDSAIELRGCTATGNPSSPSSSTTSNPGLWLRHSVAFSVESTFVGGGGGTATGCGLPSLGPSRGAPGVRIDAASAFHSVRDTVTGGAGGSGIACRPAGAQGGDAVQIDASSLRVVGSALVPGAGGYTGGRPGTQIVATGGAIVDFPVVPSLVATLRGMPLPGQPITLSLAARAGDTAILLLAYEHVLVPLPPLVTTGAVLVAPTLTIGPFTIPGGGTLDVPLALPASWPVDQWIPFQFLAAPPSLQEVWASNSVGILAR